ncbi:MAG: flagellar hook assembly protein FlgD [Syntrophobacterales bacterium]|nr:flagellar hook assembly protein FlgD [Syntrophobacterales bacterium]
MSVSTTAADTATRAAAGQFTLPAKTLGKEDFLKLLVTQLRFQDPMAPEDPKDFVAQLAQFSSLEQQLNANTNLVAVGKVVQHLADSLGMSRGVALLGKTVRGVGNALTISGGRGVSASYQLPQDARQVTVAIFDASGKTIRTLELGSQAAGLRQFTWDGKDSQGKTVADGSYSYQVRAVDRQGTGLEVTNYFTGTVQEVYQDSGGVWVKVDGRPVLVDNIISVGAN